ncbi:MAG: hypothetical protein U0904_10125, partial [Candidatus Nanopelagicales bacterium]|nr:hypothetical protein [Candidatus Nanopelagicales bacterium]
MKQAFPADAGTTLASLYGPDATGGCAGRPEWAGLECSTSMAAAPSGGSGSNITTVSAYDTLGQPAASVDTFNGGTRTTTVSYDDAGRPTGTTVTGGTSTDKAVPAVTYGYDAATGLPVSASSAATGSNPAASVSTGYDSWGREVSYTDAGGVTSATTYDAGGFTDTTGDGLTTTKWSWNSDTDHRGLPTGADYQLPGLPDTSTVSYDAAQDPTTSLVNGVVSRQKTDASGALSSLVYTTAASEDRSLGAGNGLIVGYAQTTDGLGRARVRDTTTVGALQADGDLPGSRSVAEYDHAGRLTGASMWLGSTCLSEEFGYGVESTRPTTTTGTSTGVDWKADPVKDCPTPAKTYTTSRVFNSMAQIVSGTTPTTSSSGKVTGSSGFTYGYDSLGRVTSLPGAETPVVNDGAVTQTYYVDDSVASSISFDTGSDSWLVRQYGMDPLGRQNTVTETTVTKAKAETAKQALVQARKANDSAVTTRHYGDDSDSPTWAADSTGAKTQWLPGLDGGVAAVITTSGDTSTGVVPVVSPHGDNANTLPLVDDQTS